MLNWDDYNNLSSDELRRRRDYDLFLLKQPSIHTITHKKIVVDRKICENILSERGVEV